MRVRAKISFAGTECMTAGEVRDITDNAVLSDLLRSGFVEAAEKESEDNENKRSNSRRRKEASED